MIPQPRSACPINRSLEMLGDRWSLLVLRDIAAHDRRTFRSLLTENDEGITAPMLSRRLRDLTAAGFLTKDEVPRGKQGCYSLTELGLSALPVLVELGRLGALIDPSTEGASVAAAELPERLPELRRRHGLPEREGPSSSI